MNNRLMLVLLVVLILLLVGALPTFGLHSWGYGPVGGLGFILLVVIVVLLLR